MTIVMSPLRRAFEIAASINASQTLYMDLTAVRTWDLDF